MPHLLLLLAALVGGSQISQSLVVFDNPGLTMEKEFQTENGPVTLIVGAKRGRSINFKFPESFEVKSSLTVVDGGASLDSNSARRGRKIQKVEIDSEGIPVIQGVRSPDDPNDTKVYRNARIINNILVTSNEQAREQLNILDQKNNIRPSRAFVRQGRILAGFDEPQPAVQLPSEVVVQAQQPRLQNAFRPGRAGLIDPEYFEQGLKTNDEKVVSYSYSTQGGGIKKHTSKDIVYGSGFEAIPPYEPNANKKEISKIEEVEAFNPSIQQSRQFSIGFRPMHNEAFPKPPPLIRTNRNTANPSHFQHRTQQQPSSSPKVVFPDSSSTSNSNGVPSISSVPIQNHGNTYRHVPQQSKYHSSWSSPYGSIQHHQATRRQQVGSPNIYTQNTQAQTHSSPSEWAPRPTRRVEQGHFRQSSNVNHLNSFPQQSQHQVPTPHQAFGQAHQQLIHSNIIPANPTDFVVEHSNFQSHPGAPVFSVPVPKPVQQHSVRQLPQHQQQQQHSGQFHQQDVSTFVHPNGQFAYRYPGFEVADERPIFDRMMDPIRRMGDRFRNALSPMFYAGQRFGNRFRIGERIDKIATGNLDTDAIPLVAGAGAVAALGALGAYAATKVASGQFTLPIAIGRKSSDKPATNDILLKLAEDLESEEPSFIKRFTSLSESSAWLENNCAKRVFCSLVTGAMEEEAEELPLTSGRSIGDVFKWDIDYLEKHLNLLLDRVNPEVLRKRSLKEAAQGVLNSVRQRTCENFTCNRKAKAQDSAGDALQEPQLETAKQN